MTATTGTAPASARALRPTPTLRMLLRVNGIANVTGVLLLPLAGVVAPPLGLPTALIAAIGVFYLLFGSLMWFAAGRALPRAGAVLGLIAVNPLWAATCLVLLAGDGPTTLGAVLLGAEAVLVTVLAVLELTAYRRSARF